MGCSAGSGHPASFLAGRFEVVTPTGVGKALYRVPKSGPAHVGAVGIEEAGESGLVFLSDLSQHPARGLLDQVLVVPDQDLGHLEGRPELPQSNRPQGGDDRYPSPPEVRRGGQFHGSRPEPPLSDLAPEEPRCRDVDQIPVVHAGKVVEVEPGEVTAGPRFRPVTADQDPERDHPLLVNGALEQTTDRRELEVPHGSRDPIEIGSTDSDEEIALPVIARARLEEPGELAGDRGVCQLLDPVAHLFRLVFGVTHGRKRTGEPSGLVPE